MKDPYEILGVERTASEKAIQAAYRKLAKQHHPDVNPDKPSAESRFKEISAAYALLSNAEKRARFDRGEIDAEGVEKPPERPFYRDFGDAADRAKYRTEAQFDESDLESLLRQAFRQQGQGGFAARGQDAHYTLSVDFLDAAKGAVRRLALPSGGTLDVAIPAGLKDGQILRLAGKGSPGIGGGPPGDAFVEVTVTPHHFFRREGNDIIVELPVTIEEALLGAKVHVPTIGGTVSVTIPPGSNSGTRMRLKGRGVADGHQFVELQVVLPPGEEPELVAFLESWKPKHPFNPRAALEKP